MRILLVKVKVWALTETGVTVTGDYGHRLTVSGTVPCLPTFVTRWRLLRDSGWNCAQGRGLLFPTPRGR